MKSLIIYWSRRDFRLTDNPALSAAYEKSKEDKTPILPIFILEKYMTEADSKYQFGYTSRLYLSHILSKFSSHFEKFLIIHNKVVDTFVNISKKYKITVYVNEDIHVDFYSQIKKLEKKGIEIIVKKDKLTIDKKTLSSTGSTYSIFTPFKKAIWNKFLQESVLSTVDAKKIIYPDEDILKNLKNKNIILDHSQENIWSLFSKKRLFKVGKKEYDIDNILDGIVDNDSIQNHINNFPYKDEASAKKYFDKYIKNNLLEYSKFRDSLEKDAEDKIPKTSNIATALTWGLISSRYIKQEILNTYGDDYDFYNIEWFHPKTKTGKYAGVISFLSEIIWREFYLYLMYHKPELMYEEFQERFRKKIVWVDKVNAEKRFIAWIKGKTGYKIVDAAMMQLAQTGQIHNRARMIVASILTKNLGIDWRWGQEYFRAMLLDLDEASNNGGWQWGASVGADPKPIRIFNPYLQAKNYDADGVYQKRWLGDIRFNQKDNPLIEHVVAREEALRRYGLSKEIDFRDF